MDLLRNFSSSFSGIRKKNVAEWLLKLSKENAGDVLTLLPK